jgi:polyhydroxybutyrate depolymerase
MPFYSNLPSVMADEAVLVYPSAIGDSKAWNIERDVPFFEDLYAHITSIFCVDTNRVFVTGHSSGGGMTNDLRCRMGHVFRAIAPVAGAGPATGPGISCTGQVAVWITHADNDESVKFSRGEASRDHWITANGCNADDVTPVSPDGCVSYNGCDDGYPIHWCVHHDNHNWPSYATQAMWDFFNSL